MTETSRRPREYSNAGSVDLVEQALSLLAEAKERVALRTCDDGPSAEFESIYREMYLLASEYGEYLVRHEGELPQAALDQLLVGSAELDGAIAAYRRGYRNHDRSWRKDAGRRLRQVEKAQQRVKRWLQKSARESEPAMQGARGTGL